MASSSGAELTPTKESLDPFALPPLSDYTTHLDITDFYQDTDFSLYENVGRSLAPTRVVKAKSVKPQTLLSQQERAVLKKPYTGLPPAHSASSSAAVAHASRKDTQSPRSGSPKK